MTVFIWLDLETTGLDENHSQIIEVATVITNEGLEVLGSYETLVKPARLTYEPGVIGMHKRSGLFEPINAGRGTPTEQVEKELHEFITYFEPRKKRAYLAGNNVHFDAKFLNKYMPTIMPHLCSRYLDVSSVAMAMRARFGKETSEYRAPKDHRALGDLERSIDELKYYFDHFIRMPEEIPERPTINN